MSAKILAALAQLQADNPNHWTDDGLPRVDTVKLLASDQTLTRDAITQAAIGFSRTNLVLTPETPQAAVIPPVTTSPVVTPQAAVIPDPVISSPPETGDAQAQGGSVDSFAEEQPQKQEKTLAEELAAARVRKDEAQRVKTAATKAYDEAVSEVDRLVEANEAAGGRESLASTLGGYFARQKMNLQERADKLQTIKNMGVSLKDLIPSRSPVDAAFARKTARGTKRPTT